MRRREFIIALCGLAADWPLAARAKQAGGTALMGVLVGTREGDLEGERWVKALIDGLAQLGWKRDQNLQIDLRWGGADPDRMQKLANELVDLGPDVIQVTTAPATAAILRKTRTIPVVFAVVSDPVGSGFVQSLARPGSNATGFINIEASLGGKWLELLKELAPRTSRVSIMFNPKTAPQSAIYLKTLETASTRLALPLVVAHVESSEEIEATISGLAQVPDSALVVTPDIFTGSQVQRDLINSLTARYRIPAVYFAAVFVRNGGLVSYGIDHPDLLSRAVVYVDRILKGAKPENLPVQLPTKFELTINVKTAKSLGLTIPPSMLAIADEIIE
jgi:putative tryptophan/tyrosine transport system substrate-binding protein